MSFDLAAALPVITPKAIQWANEREAEILASGESLTEQGLGLARQVGVANAEKIRIAFVTSLPLPSDPVLREAAVQTGLLGPNMIGLTLGYGIYICKSHNTTRLLSHEFRHVHQYEVAGSIAAFLPRYLLQIAEFGYTAAPYEVDARSHEIVT